MTTRFTFATFPPLVPGEVTLDVPDERAGEYAEALELLSEHTGLPWWGEARMSKLADEKGVQT